MKRPFILLIFVSLALSSSPAVWAQVEVPAPRPQTAFADWLFAQGEYARAAGEYYRFLFTAPETEKAAILRTIGECYFKAGEYHRAILVFEKLLSSYPSSPLFAETCYEAAYCSFKLGEYDAVSTQISRASASGPLPPSFLLLDAAGRLSAGDYGAGRDLLDRYLNAPGAADLEQAKALLDLAAEADRLPTRSPWAAGIFSVFIPGLGKMYSGQWGDGLVSFLLCAGLGGLAAYSFWSGGVTSFTAWMYTALGAVFYVGDIWGSAVAADRFNESRRADLRTRVRERINAVLP
ncbi:MAG: tetratricopeptide repeat protein [Spirochaetales bacterium]|nr:tetratricopeptide repeat protein [Spirochaetales bacterium]